MFYCSINANVKHSWFPVLRTVIVACNGGRCLANMRGGFTAHAQISADLHVNLLNGLSDLLLWRSGTHAFQVQRDWTACNLAFKKKKKKVGKCTSSCLLPACHYQEVSIIKTGCLSRAASQPIIKISSTMFLMIFTGGEWRRAPATKALR